MKKITVERSKMKTILHALTILLFYGLFIFFLPDTSSFFDSASFIIATFLLVSFLSQVRGGKELIIIDDSGLTVNGNIKLGPIPWDLVIDARVSNEGDLLIYFVEKHKLEKILGERVREKVERDKKTNTQWISLYYIGKMPIGDLVTLINERAEGNRENTPE